MHCPTCESRMVTGKTTLTFDKGPEQTIVIKEVPAQVCEQCGETYIDLDISKQVEKLVIKAQKDGIKMGFLSFQPAA